MSVYLAYVAWLKEYIKIFFILFGSYSDLPSVQECKEDIPESNPWHNSGGGANLCWGGAEGCL